MSNINTVKSALNAEIKHAQQGITFYATRIAALEKLIEQLDRLDNAAGANPALEARAKRPYARRVDPAAGASSMKAEKPQKAPKESKSSRGAPLPKTGNTFWQSLLSDTPMSNQELLSAAIASLQIRPTTQDLKKLKQRLANAITIMTKDGSMHSEGTGRARRFSSKAL